MKFHNFVLSLNKTDSNNKTNNYYSLKKNNKNEFINPIKFRSPLKKFILMSNAENIEKNYQLRQIIHQYKSLNKDYKIRKRNNEHFFLYSKKDLEYEEKKNNLTSNISYLNKINSLKKNNSDLLKYPLIKRDKEKINDNSSILSYKNKNNNSKKREPSLLMKYLSQKNFFFYQKNKESKINMNIHNENKVFKITEMDKIINKFKNKMYNSTENLKLKSNLW